MDAQAQQQGYSLEPRGLVYLLVPGNHTSNLVEGAYFRVDESFSSDTPLSLVTSQHRDSPPPTASMSAVGAYASPGSLGGAVLAISIDGYSLSGDASCELQYTDYSTNISYYRCYGYPSGRISYRAYVVGIPQPGYYEVPANVRVVGVISTSTSSSSGSIAVPNPMIGVLVVKVNITEIRPSGVYSMDRVGNTYFFEPRQYSAVVDVSSSGYGSASIWVQIEFFGLNQSSSTQQLSPEDLQKILSTGVSMIEQAASDVNLVSLGSYRLSFSLSGSQIMRSEVTINTPRRFDKIVYLAEAGIDGGGSAKWAGGFNTTAGTAILSIYGPSGYIVGGTASFSAYASASVSNIQDFAAQISFSFTSSPPLPGLGEQSCTVYLSPQAPTQQCSVSSTLSEKPVGGGYTVKASYRGSVRLANTEFQVSGSMQGQAPSIPNPRVSNFGRYLYIAVLAPVVLIAAGALLFAVHSYLGGFSDVMARISSHYLEVMMAGVGLLVVMYGLPVVSYNLVAYLLNSMGSSYGYTIPYVSGVTPDSFMVMMSGYDQAFDKVSSMLSSSIGILAGVAAGAAAIAAFIIATALIPSILSPIGMAVSSIFGPIAATLIIGVIGTFLALLYAQLGMGVAEALIALAIALTVGASVIGAVMSIFPGVSSIGFQAAGGAAASMIVIMVGGAASGYVASVINHYVNQIAIPDVFSNFAEAATKIGLAVGTLGGYAFFSAAVKIAAAGLIVAFIGAVIGGAIASIPLFGGLLGGAIATITRIGRGG
ncbi:MAG: hypothetical protein QXW41_08515 [Fervidicoccaceae archaeon]